MLGCGSLRKTRTNTIFSFWPQVASCFSERAHSPLVFDFRHTHHFAPQNAILSHQSLQKQGQGVFMECLEQKIVLFFAMKMTAKWTLIRNSTNEQTNEKTQKNILLFHSQSTSKYRVPKYTISYENLKQNNTKQTQTYSECKLNLECWK